MVSWGELGLVGYSWSKGILTVKLDQKGPKGVKPRLEVKGGTMGNVVGQVECLVRHKDIEREVGCQALNNIINTLCEQFGD